MNDKKNITKYQGSDEIIGIEDLKNFLWKAATHLRGQIDAAGYKEYIFPLLFFKRISDVYDEQFEDYVHDGGLDYAKEQAKELAIIIPDGAHWNDVRKVTENVGQALVQAFIDIEQANPAQKVGNRMVGGLEGIFGPKDGWTNKNKMPDYVITSLIEDFSKYNLSLSHCPADEMGQAYEYLIGKFADDAGNTAQEFYTNRTVVELMAEILQPQPDESIYDPTCGSGGMLVKCLDYLRNQGKEWQGVHVYGQEINGLTSSIARMNLYLNGVEDFSIACADTLSAPAFTENGKLQTFDVVLANPPYSIKEWDRTAFEHDKWGRNFLGTPPQARADYAFIQHILCSMDRHNGRCAVLLPHGVLNRNEEKEMRINHVKTDTIEAIIGLGRNLFYNSGLESFILICRNKKQQNRNGKILFIEAENCTHKEGKQAYLYSEDIDKIMQAYHSDEDIPGFSKWVTNDEILDNDGNLNIKSYVKQIDEENVNGQEALHEFISSENELADSLDNLQFTAGQYCPRMEDVSISTDLDKSNWKKVKLSDVAEEHTIRVPNPSKSAYDFYIGSNCIDQYDFTINRRMLAQTVTSAQKGFEKGDYLLVRRSLYGSDFRERAPRAEFDGVCSADIITLREKKNVIADGFLIYILYQKDLWDFIVANSNGGLTRRIKWKQLADYEFLLPPLSEQKALADKLWTAYRLKESYKKLLQATDDMVKAEFLKMFSGKEFPQKQWKDILTITNGKAYKKSEYKEKGKFPICGSAGVMAFCDEKMCEANTIILGRKGNINNPIFMTMPYWIVDTAFSLKVKEELRPKFFYYWCKLFNFLKYNKQGVLPSLVRKDLEKIYTIVPPIGLQMDFEKIFDSAEQTKSSLRRSISSIDKVIKSMINN